MLRRSFLAAALLFAACGTAPDPLPSWIEGAARQAIIGFVQRVASQGRDFVPPAERIAVFDNDGTMWAEQPIYVMIRFAADRMKALAPGHPEWVSNAAFQSVITGDTDAILKLGGAEQFAVGFAVHAGMSTGEYTAAAREWLRTHHHPRFRRPYTDLAYQPMLELTAYLRGAQFQVYSVTGAEIDFTRVVNEQAFGIPRDHVIGTVLKTKFDGTQLEALPDPLLIDDGDGKPISIHNVIGRRPIAAFGNSDGDLSMLQWTTSEPGARLAVYIHHDDAEREFAYDRASPVGKLDKGLDMAAAKGWTVVSMKNDWKQIFR